MYHIIIVKNINIILTSHCGHLDYKIHLLMTSEIILSKQYYLTL